jgi:hypothetical protein
MKSKGWIKRSKGRRRLQEEHNGMIRIPDKAICKGDLEADALAYTDDG